MTVPDLDISPAIIGCRVAVPGRPEWGVGTVLRVQTSTVEGRPVHRVSIHFPTGHRTLLVPPARLVSPQPEPERVAGWLDTLAGRTVDDRLRRLPPEITEFIGTPAARVAALAALYAHTEEGPGLLRWAQRQAGVADPLSHWSRDELLVSFRAFCDERDAVLRAAGALLRRDEGPEALERALSAVAASGPLVAERMRAALRRPL